MKKNYFARQKPEVYVMLNLKSAVNYEVPIHDPCGMPFLWFDTIGDKDTKPRHIKALYVQYCAAQQMSSIDFLSFISFIKELKILLT